MQVNVEKANVKVIRSEIIHTRPQFLQVSKDGGKSTAPGAGSDTIKENIYDFFQSKNSSVAEMKPVLEGALCIPSVTNDRSNSYPKSPPRLGESSYIPGGHYQQSLD